MRKILWPSREAGNRHHHLLEKCVASLGLRENPTTKKHIASLEKWTNYVFQPEEVFLNSERPRIRNMMEGLVGARDNNPI